MNIVVSHFHLQTGGVTRVVQHACSALLDAGHRVLVLSGEPPQMELPTGTVFALVPALGYEERRTGAGPRELAEELERSARIHLGAPADLWHVHNHSLGKNLALPGALIHLARRGHRLLLQLHDFAEDGRPALYARLLDRVGDGDPARLAGRLYPLAHRIHYAVLNGRDRSFLAAAGIPGTRLHLLPNATAMPGTRPLAAHPFGNRRLWLYPTRAIRRKNLGEFLLWSLLGEEQDLFAATQAPQNPAEQVRYRRWAALAAELGLPVELEVGNQVDSFTGLLASAHALVTTSVAEGFGLAFLEPWLAGRPLVGRDLPEITRDFTAAGIDLGGLYTRLEIPLDWLDAGRLRRTFGETLEQVVSAYGRKVAGANLERVWGEIVRQGRIDFGRLDETAQEEVIRHLHASPGDRLALRPLRLDSSVTTDADRIARNRAVIERDFSLAGYARRLCSIYDGLLAEPVEDELAAADAGALLDRFLAPERLYLLRT